MRIVYLGSHAILEYDELRLFHSLGHEVFSIGAYIHPSRPMEDKRPGLDIPEQPELIAAVDALGQQGFTDTIAQAKRHLPDAILDWAEVIIVSAFEHEWLIPQWPRFKGKRVIWRTIGQSGDRNEQGMAPLFAEGCEIVRYSPKERNIPNYAGESAVIRFYKDPAEWHGWTGEDRVVTNVTQNMLNRDPWCNPRFWFEATKGLPVRPMGPGSEEFGGIGQVTTDQLKDGLRRSRAYLYTGTQPASYTLGFIEALMTGIPLICIPAAHMKILDYGRDLFEASDIAPLTLGAADARANLLEILRDDDFADHLSRLGRRIAVETFGMETIGEQWQSYLVGAPVAVAA